MAKLYTHNKTQRAQMELNRAQSLQKLSVVPDTTPKRVTPVQTEFNFFYPPKTDGSIKVSIICLTYNHEPYIKQTLDSFLMQKTNFGYEIIIHDDASTDGTSDIIREYAKIYPDIIKPIIQTENQLTKTGIYPLKHMYELCNGKYHADCDGDDYWTDEYKLQKQFDFLESNPTYSMCHHRYMVSGKKVGLTSPKGTPRDFSQMELITISNSGYGVHPCTRMRRNFYKGHEKEYEICDGDVTILILMGTFGATKYLPNIEPSIYRQFSSSHSWSCLNKAQKGKSITGVILKIEELLKLTGNQTWIYARKSVVFK